MIGKPPYSAMTVVGVAKYERATPDVNTFVSVDGVIGKVVDTNKNDFIIVDNSEDHPKRIKKLNSDHWDYISVNHDGINIIPRGYILVTSGSSIKMLENTIDVKVGDVIFVSEDGIAVLNAHNPIDGPEVTIIKLEGERALVTLGSDKWVINSLIDVEIGDKVTLDFTKEVVIRITEKGEKAAEVSKVNRSDIFGLDEIIDDITRNLKSIPDELKQRYNLKESRGGLLLYGPAGNGKTLIARYLAGEFDMLWRYIKGPEVMSMWVGEAEARIRAIFERAANDFRKTGKKTMVVIDEADALFPTRGTMRSSDATDSVVSTWLACTGGFTANYVYPVILTNMQSKLDPAVTRPGRIDMRKYVPRPTKEVSEGIAKVYLGKRPVYDMNEAASKIANFIFDGRIVQNIQINGKQVPVPFNWHVSGALIENIVERATEIAVARNIATSSYDEVSENDIQQSLNAIFDEYKKIEPIEMLMELGIKNAETKS